MSLTTWMWPDAGKKGAESVVPPIGVGDSVKVRDFRRLPLAGQLGTVMDVDESETDLCYVVHFGGGLRFRYQGADLDRVNKPDPTQKLPKSSSSVRIVSGIG